MNKNSKIEVHETEEDFKDLLLKKKIDIKLLLVILAIAVLVSNGQIVRIYSMSYKSIIFFTSLLIISIFLVIFGTRKILINGFKEGMINRKELFNYTLIFDKNELTIERGKKYRFKYDQITLKESKKSYFIYYPVANKKQVAILNKENHTKEEKQIIELYLKKQ